MKLWSIRRRIAVVGTTFSGKTVFLTSLINHLKDHVPADFHLGPKVRIKRFREEAVPSEVGSQFPYREYREAIATEGKWPRKTCDTSHYVFTFERTDWKFTSCAIDFFDFPGERHEDDG